MTGLLPSGGSQLGLGPGLTGPGQWKGFDGVGARQAGRLQPSMTGHCLAKQRIWRAGALGGLPALLAGYGGNEGCAALNWQVSKQGIKAKIKFETSGESLVEFF